VIQVSIPHIGMDAIPPLAGEQQPAFYLPAACRVKSHDLQRLHHFYSPMLDKKGGRKNITII